MKSGWVYLMADRYRGTNYIGVTADLAARIHQHRTGDGSDFVRRYGLHRLVYAERHERIENAIAREKAVKNWRREWKIRLIEEQNPDWLDRYSDIL